MNRLQKLSARTLISLFKKPVNVKGNKISFKKKKLTTKNLSKISYIEGMYSKISIKPKGSKVKVTITF